MFIVLQIIVFFIILFLVYLLTWFLPTDSPWSPWWSTSKKVSRLIARLARVGKKDVFYELGSGTGTTVTVMAKEFGAKCVGIESDFSRVLWSRLKISIMKQKKNVKIIQGSFFEVDLSPATVVYLYLVPRVIKKLKPKLLNDLKRGTRVVSYVYQIDYLKKIAEDNNKELYVYRVD